MKLFSRHSISRLHIALLLLVLILGQTAQIWHHADLFAHEQAETCQVCLHASAKATGTTSMALRSAIWLLASLLVGGLLLLQTRRSVVRYLPRAPPFPV